ncbi:hypothetical protein [Xanthomonas sp. NCPPB 2632]|jgi:hypothetical protein|uniref:hypothetical protein n=1 Tax=Xanthomonas sp. NCPPB 2632 TaxID=3240912 RepID=UPI00351774B2
MLPNTGWLLLGVVAMYVYDATLLLYHNEVVLYEGRRGRWTFSAGTEFQLAGRHVFVPPLLAPTRALLRLRWSARPHAPAASDTSDVTLAPMAPLRGLRAWRIGVASSAGAVGVVALLFAAMPAVMAGNVWGLLAWMVALYVAIAIAVWRVGRVRRLTGTGGKAFAGMASDALLCAPYALNLVRKQGLRAADRFDLVAVAQAVLDADERARLRDVIRARVQRQLDIEEVGSEAHARLQAYYQRIEGALA